MFLKGLYPIRRGKARAIPRDKSGSPSGEPPEGYLISSMELTKLLRRVIAVLHLVQW